MNIYMKQEDIPYFIFNGISSLDFKIIKIKDDRLNSAERNIEITPIPGKDSGHISEKAQSNKNIKVEIALNADSTEEINILSKKIKKWLHKDKTYKELIFSDDLDTIYEAICINKIELDEVIEALGVGVIYFSCKPYTKTRDNSIIEIIKNDSLIYNQYSQSNPKFKIYGNGDVTISINNENLIIKEISEYIEVDSEEMECFKLVDGVIKYENDKMYSDFPVLKEGVNNISWIGNISKIEIIPNWREN